MRRVVGAAVGVVLGCLLVFGAASGVRGDDVVTCAGSEMRPGGICLGRTSRGEVTRTGYDELRTSRSTGPLLGIGLGSVIVLVAAVKLVGAVRERRRAAVPDVPPGQPRPVRGTWGPRQPVAKPPRPPQPDDPRQPLPG